ncbi:hydrogenase maturation protease [Phenylobacterium sp.]|uniref:hydrogenase maturation protease n=1 Tax=Phenylobacterium sp. TaxID=1871053 RepID=UPI0035B294AA
MAEPGEVLVLGIGNPDRGDDGVGRMAARLLAADAPAHVEVAESGGEATDILEHLEDAASAILIDACATGGAAGTVHRFDVSVEGLPSGVFGVSTHGFGLHEAIELGRALGCLPRRCVVYAIEGERFETGAPLSEAVAAAAEEVALRVRAELAGGWSVREPGHA